MLLTLLLVAGCGGSSDPESPVAEGAVEAAAAATEVPAASSPDSDDAPESDGSSMAEASDDGTVASDAEAEIPGVTVIPLGPAAHVEGPVDYSTSPGAGGDHDRGWQNCGFYTVELPEEQAVHSLEHGAVWVAYGADADTEELEVLSKMIDASTHLLASPYPGLGSSYILTAWGRQAAIDSLDDPLFTDFLATYMGQGPTTPEPGATCAGAYGIPPTDTTTIA